MEGDEGEESASFLLSACQCGLRTKPITTDHKPLLTVQIVQNGETVVLSFNNFQMCVLLLWEFTSSSSSVIFSI